MEENYNRKWNMLLLAIFIVIWLLWSIGYPLMSPEPVTDSNLYLGWLPLIIGLFFAILLTGDWFRRVVWSSAMPIIPILITLVFLARGTEPEGTAFALIFSVGPFLSYAVGVLLGIGLIHTLSRSDKSVKRP